MKRVSRTSSIISRRHAVDFPDVGHGDGLTAEDQPNLHPEDNGQEDGGYA